jgi:plasmid stabilization system protein ParE
MEPLSIDFDPEAAAEANEAYCWYAKRSQRAADAFIAELDRAIDSIREQPNRFAKYLHGTQRCLLKRYPYAVVYRATEVAIQVVAVAHGKRRPGYWKGRL